MGSNADSSRVESGHPFDDVETEILRQYFGLKPRLRRAKLLVAPDAEGSEDTEDDQDEESEAKRDARCGVRVPAENTFEEFYDDAPIANAVARICLNVVRHRLPNWTAIGANGKFLSERTPEPSRGAPLVAIPRHLFTVNWADSGPGYPWPESYYVTPVVGFDRFVVTGSKDSDELYGFADLALGWFRAREDVSYSSGRIIRRWWRFQRREFEQAPWESFLDAGVVDEQTALVWRRKACGNPDQYD